MEKELLDLMNEFPEAKVKFNFYGAFGRMDHEDLEIKSVRLETKLNESSNFGYEIIVNLKQKGWITGD